MSRRVHACVSCPGRTRHRGPCAACRGRGVRLVGDTLTVPLELRVPRVLVGPTRMVRLVDPANPHAPTVAELKAGVDLTRYLLADGQAPDLTPCFDHRTAAALNQPSRRTR